MNKENNPFIELSNIFVENQRQLNIKTDDLRNRLNKLSEKISKLSKVLEDDVFSANLVTLLNIEDEARLIFSVAKELEFQREGILTSLQLLKKSKEIKLNK